MYKYTILPHFQKQVKDYEKKYRFMRDDIIASLKNFSPLTADHLGNNIFKLRCKVRELNRGKRGSFRLILAVVYDENLLVPLTIYYKGDRASISRKEIRSHLDIIGSEMEKFI